MQWRLYLAPIPALTLLLGLSMLGEFRRLILCIQGYRIEVLKAIAADKNGEHDNSYAAAPPSLSAAQICRVGLEKVRSLSDVHTAEGPGPRWT